MTSKADVEPVAEGDKVDQRHQLFLQEIESIDEYWGPTFRTIYDSEEHTKFLEKLSGRITSHDRDIERMCNHYYHGFIDSIHDLLTVREQATKLKTEVTKIDKDLQDSSQKVISKSEELLKARRVSSNICEAMEALSACLPVLKTYSKLQTQIQEKRYYPALKTLEQLEHTYLPRVTNYKFTEQLRASIPTVREDIKAASMTEIRDFLEEVRRISPRIGQVAMLQHADTQSVTPVLSPVSLSSLQNKEKESNPFSEKESNPFDQSDNPFEERGDAKTNGGSFDSSCDSQSAEECDLSPEDLVDFCPVLRCLHIHSVLGEKNQFHTYYRTQRQEQARLALQPPNNMHESVTSFREYIDCVLGFFVVEEHLANIAPGLMDDTYRTSVWEMAQSKVVNNIRNQSSYITDTAMLLEIKKLVLLFSGALKTFGYSANCIQDLLLEIKDHYNEVLMSKWLQVFREIFDEDNYHPITVETEGEYTAITQVFPYQDTDLEASPFPKQFPFSLMVPKVYSQVKNFIVACLQFSEDLSLSASSKEDMVRRSTNLLLTRTLSGCLASLIKRPGLGLLQLIQITINTFHLEEANTLLEHYVARLTGSSNTLSSSIALMSIGTKTPRALGNLQGKVMFKDIRGEAEEQIYTALLHKLDEFLELAGYDWMLVEVSGQGSTFITDLIAFLDATFAAFTNLPVRVAGTACMSACQHISRSLLSLLTADSVKQLSLAALEQLSLDVMQCEIYASREPVEGLEEGALVLCFANLRQLLDLLLSEDWSTYFNEYGRTDAKFLRVNPSTAAQLVEKLMEGEKKGVFSRLKRSDKKKLYETVLKQLRQITHSQHS